MTDFTTFNLPPLLLEAVARLNITTPTPIQAASLPVTLTGRDVLASARTGSGKTLAYALPMIAKLLADPNSAALILAPTRELAAQIKTSIQALLGPRPAFKIALLIGGESMFRQYNQLNAGPRVVVGTPGRIRDHVERGTLVLDVANFLAIDEADRMLDMGFGEQLEFIAKCLPEERQTLMFSATLPANIIKLANQYLTKPERIAVDSTEQPAVNIKQEMIHTPVAEKFSHLQRELEAREGSIIIFVKTKRGADQLTQKLLRHDHSAEAIHGDLRQRQRDRVIEGFRNHEYRIMVATDVAARGIDIPHIAHVINYDLPQCPEDYIHRIGRTARAGKSGSALCLISPEDGGKWKAIHRLINPGAPAERYRGGRSDERSGGRARPYSKGKSNAYAKSNGGPRSEGAARSERGPRSEGAARSERGPRSEGVARSERGPRSEGAARSERGPRSEGAARSDRAHRSAGTTRPNGGERTAEGRARAERAAKTERGARAVKGFKSKGHQNSAFNHGYAERFPTL